MLDEKITAYAECPAKDAKLDKREKNNMFVKFCATIGKSEITAKKVVKTLGLVIIIRKALLKANDLAMPIASILFSRLLKALEKYLIAKYHNNKAPISVSPNFNTGNVKNSIAAPDKAAIAQTRSPNPQA